MAFLLSSSASAADKHTADVATLVFHNDKLYSGGEDGKIKVWNRELKLLAETQAHPVNVYSLAATAENLYSSSNDGTIKAWSLTDLIAKANLLEASEDEILQLYYDREADVTYSGDEKGHVKVWKDGKLQKDYGISQPINGVRVKGEYLATTGHMDTVIIQMVKDSKTNLYTVKYTADGIGPLSDVKMNEKWILAFVDRNGRDIKIVDASQPSKSNLLCTLQGHQAVINVVQSLEGDSLICSGGYDRHAKVWDVETKGNIASINVDKCVNSVAIANKKEIYVAGQNGFLEKWILK